MFSILFCLLAAVIAAVTGDEFAILYPNANVSVAIGQLFEITWQGGAGDASPYIKIYDPSGNLYDWDFADINATTYAYRMPTYSSSGWYKIVIVDGLEAASAEFYVAASPVTPPIVATTTYVASEVAPSYAVSGNATVVVAMGNALVTETLVETSGDQTFTTTVTTNSPTEVYITEPAYNTYVIWSSGESGWVTVPYTVTYAQASTTTNASASVTSASA